MRWLFLAIVLLVIGLGFYQEWFSFAADHGARSNLTLSVDTDRFREDRKTAMAKVQDRPAPSEKTTNNEVFARIKEFAINRHDGNLVRTTDSKLVMLDRANKELTFILNNEAKITLDGKVCKAADLKHGLRIRVTTEDDDARDAKQIEAIDRNRHFEEAR